MNLLTTMLAGVRMESPLVLASGILGLTASSMAMVARSGAGAVTTKSCGIEPRPGHPGPAILPLAHGMLNAVGLSNPGIDEAVREIERFRERCEAPLFLSIFGRTVEEFDLVAQRAAQAGPDLIEVNVSCPNVASDLGQPFEANRDDCARIVRLVKKAAGSIPVAIKLSINWGAIGPLARACQENGADAITAINTVGPGMHIDVGVRRPVLSNRVGGLSGPAILPLAVKAVWELYRSVRVPIIGVGGVCDTDGALQMIMAGATAVGVGSGVYFGGLGVFGRINAGIARFMHEQDLTSLDDIRGAAHE